MRSLKQIASLFLMAITSLFSAHSIAHGLEPIFISVITMENNQYRVELRLPDEFKEENSLISYCQTTVRPLNLTLLSQRLTVRNL